MGFQFQTFIAVATLGTLSSFCVYKSFFKFCWTCLWVLLVSCHLIINVEPDLLGTILTAPLDLVHFFDLHDFELLDLCFEYLVLNVQDFIVQQVLALLE